MKFLAMDWIRSGRKFNAVNLPAETISASCAQDGFHLASGKMRLAGSFSLVPFPLIGLISCEVVCPEDLSQMYPCQCQNGSGGLLIRRPRVNLATLWNYCEGFQARLSRSSSRIARSRESFGQSSTIHRGADSIN